MSKVRKLLACLCHGYYRTALLRHRVAAGVEHEAMLGALSCRSVVDIGANRGQFALVARRHFPDAHITCFEPLLKPSRILQRVFDEDALTTLHRCAIGPMCGESTIHISRRDDSSSLLPITDEQDRVFPGTAEKETGTVQVRQLQDLIAPDELVPPALLKLDVQGFELQALQGCESLLNRFAYVYAECSFVELYQGQALADAVIAWLRERGFRLMAVHNLAYTQAHMPIQGDFLFISSQVFSKGM